MKKAVSFFLATILTAISLAFFAPPVEAEAASTSLTENNFAKKIEELQERYPHKQYWNQYNGTETIAGRTTAKAGPIPCDGTRTDSDHYDQKCTSVGFCYVCTCKCGIFVGEQCFGFANLMAHHTFGSYAIAAGKANTSNGWNYLTSVSEFYAGDVVRINGDSHSIFIHKVTDTDVYYVDCNSDVPCQIEWNNKISVSKLKSRITYVVRMQGNTLKGTGNASAGSLTINYHANGGTIADPVAIGTNYRVTTTDGTYAIVRSGPGQSYSEIARYPSGTVLAVTETQKKSDYTWGKIQHEKEAWVALGDWMISVGTAYDPPYYLSSSIVYNRETSQPVAPSLAYGEQLKDGLYNNTTFKLYREGYSFLGWSLTADGSGTIIDQDQAIKPEEIVPEIANENITVTMYAIWKFEGDCNHTYETKYESTGDTFVPSAQHWQECTNCGDKKDYAPHNWSLFPYTIDEGHIYRCNDCGEVTYEVHTYSNTCEIYCNICNYERSVIHQYDNACDSICNVCGATRSTAHVYTNNCDSSCNVCGANRTATHKYSNNCDTSCDTCGATRVASHTYSNNCDSSCNTCGATRNTSHTYTNICDADCNICGAKRNASHVYTNNCDAICNVCAEARIAAHKYTNECDEDCDICKEKRTTAHIYGEPDIIVSPTCQSKGTQKSDCLLCGATKTEEIEKTDHNFKSTIEGDYIKYSCENCDYSFTEPNPKPDDDDNDKQNKDDDDDDVLKIAPIIGGSIIIGLTAMGLTIGLIIKKKQKQIG